ncbi:MAG: lipopolysaccharide biosynthesis protein [Saprospiraceae bacterium]|nr:lipopolysaccharide biosynthesis protein [Saprospiraceae bacterium]
MVSLKNKTWLGIQWSFGSQVVNQAMVLIFNLALLSWLTPQDFGLFAFPYLVFSFFRSFHDFGYGDVLIVKKEWNPLTFSSIFWLTTAIALLCTVLMIFFAPGMATWTRNTGSESILIWLGMALMLGAAQAGLEVVFRKNLLFEKLFWMEFYANLTSGMVAIYMAWQGYGIYALIGKTLTYVAVLSVLSLIMVPEKPKFQFSMAEVKSHFSFATANIGDQLVQFVFKNADTFLLARFAPATHLGWYDRAFKLLVFPVQQASASVARVILPAFSTYGDDKEKLAAAYLKLMATSALLAFPFLVIIPFVSEEVVFLLFDPSWRPLSTLFSIFTLMALTQGVFALGNPIFYLSGRVSTLFRFSLISRSSAVLVLCFAIFTGQDIEWVALSFTLAATFFVLPFQHLVLKMLNIGWSRFWKSIERVVLGCILIGVSLILLHLFTGAMDTGTALLLKIIIALLVYAVVVKNDLLALAGRH